MRRKSSGPLFGTHDTEKHAAWLQAGANENDARPDSPTQVVTLSDFVLRVHPLIPPKGGKAQIYAPEAVGGGDPISFSLATSL